MKLSLAETLEEVTTSVAVEAWLYEAPGTSPAIIIIS